MVQQQQEAPNKKQNLLALLIYFLDLYIFSPVGIIVSILFLIFEKKNPFVRFHAMQSLLVFGSLFVIDIAFFFVPYIGGILNTVLIIVYLILWVLLMVKAYQGSMYKLPYIGNLA